MMMAKEMLTKVVAAATVSRLPDTEPGKVKRWKPFIIEHHVGSRRFYDLYHTPGHLFANSKPGAPVLGLICERKGAQLRSSHAVMDVQTEQPAGAGVGT